MKLSNWTLLRLLARVANAGFVWCLSKDRPSRRNRSVPIEYRPGVWNAYFYGPDGETCELRQIL